MSKKPPQVFKPFIKQFDIVVNRHFKYISLCKNNLCKSRLNISIRANIYYGLGIVKTHVVPLPGLLSKVNSPLFLLIKSRHKARPRPAPFSLFVP